MTSWVTSPATATMATMTTLSSPPPVVSEEKEEAVELATVGAAEGAFVGDDTVTKPDGLTYASSSTSTLAIESCVWMGCRAKVRKTANRLGRDLFKIEILLKKLSE